MTWKMQIATKAEKDLNWFRSHERILYLKSFDLVRATLLDPRTGIGQPERLKHFSPKEVWSRRVNRAHRMVYIIWEKDRKIEVVGFKSHYE
jgi:toxin YoeB